MTTENTIEQHNEKVNTCQEAYNNKLRMLKGTYECAESDQWKIVEQAEKELGVCAYELEAAKDGRTAFIRAHTGK